MAAHDKLIERFKSRPADFTWDELVRLLGGCGYRESKRGASSRRTFDGESLPKIKLHKPHPSNVVKRYVLDEVRDTLEKAGLI